MKKENTKMKKKKNVSVNISQSMTRFPGDQLFLARFFLLCFDEVNIERKL